MTGEIGSMLLAILPEIGLVVLAIGTLAMDLLWRDRRCQRLALTTAIGSGVIIILSLLFARPGPQPVELWGGAIRLDQAGFVFRMIFVFAAGLTALLVMENEGVCSHGEFFSLLMVSTLGMSLLASTYDLITLYLAFETASIPLYVLAGFLLKDNKSVESGIKYMLYGAMTSAILLYGFSLLYGFTGTTNLGQLAQLLNKGQVSPIAVGLTMLLVLVGFAFKISAVPVHFWAPDTYEGAPTPLAGFLSTASKAAGFAALMRVLLVIYPGFAELWTWLVAAMAVASMLVGNLQALAQKNMKRLLAFSSIAQAGTILIGVAVGTQFGTSATIYYLIAYLVTNLAGFGLVMVVGKALGSDDITAYAGLSRRSPALALLFLAVLLSLGGIPPFAGFVGKFLVFGAAIEAGKWPLAAIGVINSILALYYYLRILKVIYLNRSAGDEKPLVLERPWTVALVICAAGILLLGIVIAPWYNWSSQAATAILTY